ncbi:bestrophin family protein [Nannocystis exedens]|uniref:bestrophin family protein n=1 Tax=Nannocystis exedens TaxID=54 RepID=UPI000BBA0ABF|nr:bestrophin family ion channel [Nannocystis exedens]
MPKAQPNPTESLTFWQDALAWRGAVMAKVLPRTALFGVYACFVSLLHLWSPWEGADPVHLGYAGGFFALLLTLRTSTGYERWWEARKLWGGIVNQSRSLAISAVEYGPRDRVWRQQFVRWSAVFCHAARQTLTGEDDAEALTRVLGDPPAARELLAARHMPSRVVGRLARLLRQAREQGGLDGFDLLVIDRERAALIEHIGSCERILRTALPRVHSIKLRRFIFLYLLGLPLALETSQVWVTPLITMLVAYLLFAIDQIGHELENPFDTGRASHLPLRAICSAIEADLMTLLADDERAGV